MNLKETPIRISTSNFFMITILSLQYVRKWKLFKILFLNLENTKQFITCVVVLNDFMHKYALNKIRYLSVNCSDQEVYTLHVCTHVLYNREADTSLISTSVCISIQERHPLNDTSYYQNNFLKKTLFWWYRTNNFTRSIPCAYGPYEFVLCRGTCLVK